MIRDQRTMTGVTPLQTPEDVIQTWLAYVQHPAFPGFTDGRLSRDLIEDDTEVLAYVSAGRWVADCVTPGCNGGIACWPDHAKACCLDCGHIFSPTFPDTKTRVDAELLLVARPEENQNWRPDKGEEVRMLVAENIAANVPVAVAPEDVV